MRRPLDSAAGAAREVLGEAGIPAAEDLIAAIRRFERIEFDVPDEGDTDGFLFQYGIVNWFAEPTFTLGFVRQLEMVDAEGDHEAFLQVQLEYRYRPDPDLEARNANSWWFRGEPQPFETWLSTVEQDPIWTIVRGKRPTAFDISQELA